MSYRFEDPLLLLLLLALPAFMVWYVRKGRRGGALRYPGVPSVRRAGGGRRAWTKAVLLGMRGAALAAFIVALARPQSGVTGEEVTTEGIDIVVVLDVSSSMLAEDLEPNRLEAAKAVAADFIEGRGDDRIGLVIFAGDAFTQAPLTLDHSVVTDLLGRLEVGMIEDGTAVGMGLATAVKRLQASEAASRVAVLLTDGRSNAGEIGPVTAAEMAQALGVKVYTIGAGTRGAARVPVTNRFGGRQYVSAAVDIDEPTLQDMARITGGQYFRATDRDSLEEVWAQIDELERTEIEIQNFTSFTELFHWPLGLGLLLLSLEFALGRTVLRTLP